MSIRSKFIGIGSKNPSFIFFKVIFSILGLSLVNYLLSFCYFLGQVEELGLRPKILNCYIMLVLDMCNLIGRMVPTSPGGHKPDFDQTLFPFLLYCSYFVC